MKMITLKYKASEMNNQPKAELCTWFTSFATYFCMHWRTCTHGLSSNYCLEVLQGRRPTTVQPRPQWIYHGCWHSNGYANCHASRCITCTCRWTNKPWNVHALLVSLQGTTIQLPASLALCFENAMEMISINPDTITAVNADDGEND